MNQVLIDIEPGCKCDEGVLQPFRAARLGVEEQPYVAAPKVHNCRYIRDRNALIPAAERIANGEVAGTNRSFSGAFMHAMELLFERDVAVLERRDE